MAVSDAASAGVAGRRRRVDPARPTPPPSREITSGPAHGHVPSAAIAGGPGVSLDATAPGDVPFIDLDRADASVRPPSRVPPRELTPAAGAVLRSLPALGWTIVSVGAFALLWELLWYLGVTDPKLLPPPHVFLGEMGEQARFFNTAQRWQIGADPSAGPSPWRAVGITVMASTLRVLVGIAIAAVLAISLGVAIRYWVSMERLVLPTVTLLSPVSPIAWLPVAIFLFGIGNAPAIFMVVIALFFQMTIATINRIDDVDRHLINVGRTMGATKAQIYRHVIVPSILPGVFAILRLNLLAAWMVVLIAESTGVGYGLGQVIMLARNTFNPSLVFFCIALIGALGFTTDWLLRQIQRRALYWIDDNGSVFRGL